jgi:hypothetical protein
VTPLGTPELVLALERCTDAGGEEWVRARLPVAPHGTTGWIRASALGALREVTTALVVDRAAFNATLTDGGRVVLAAPVAIGRPDWPTPAGRFYVRQRVVPPARSLYGAFAFGTSARVDPPPWAGGDYVGIHGTLRPEKVPGHASRGCVRLRNEDVLRLREAMPLGTPVCIV